MTVAAPPRPPQVAESAGHDPARALIEEAKQRARRRRWIYGGVATVVAIAAVASLTIPTSSTPPPNGATPHVPAPSGVPLGAPLVVGPDASSTLLTSYGAIHHGYAFVYADGRVIWHPDGGSREVERRLTQRGLDLVRDGRIVPTDLVSSILEPRHPGTPNLWAEPTPTTYEPSHYAVCFTMNPPHPPVPLDPTQVVAQLPAPVQALLHGKERHVYDPKIGAPWSFTSTPQECFKVTADETTTLLHIPVPPDDLASFVPVMSNYKDMDLQSEYAFHLSGMEGHYMWVYGLYPHGQYVTWGG